MIVRALDDNNDWTYGKGRNDYKSGISAVEQSLQTRISSFIGDCFFDTTAGIDWLNLLGSKNILAIQLAVSAVILNTENIISILELTTNLDPTSRHLSLFYKVQSVFGVVTSFQIFNTQNLLTQFGDPLVTEDGDDIII